MRYFQATLAAIRRLNRDNTLLYFQDSEIAGQAEPGQFVMVSADTDAVYPNPLLMRPFSIFGVDPQKGEFSILVKVVGAGTRRLASFPEGTRLRMIGLLGNAFTVSPGSEAWMVAGGVGIAPFYLMCQRLRSRNIQPVLFYGARSRDDLVTLEDFAALGVRIEASTEDGSFGAAGRITGLLEGRLQEARADLFACGPTPMLEAVAALARRHEVRLEVSVECYMGCGFGACFGCAVETTEGLQLACQKGPVFDGLKMVWGRGHV